MGKVPIERKFEKNSDGFSFYHIRPYQEMEGLEYNNLFGLKLCKIMFKKGFNKWVMVNFYTHTSTL